MAGEVDNSKSYYCYEAGFGGGMVNIIGPFLTLGNATIFMLTRRRSATKFYGVLPLRLSEVAEWMTNPKCNVMTLDEYIRRTPHGNSQT